MKVNALYAWRIKKNLSQEQVAKLFTEKAKELGINDNWKGHYIVSRKERGDVEIDKKEAKILSELTGLPREWFLYPDEYQEEIQAYIEGKQLTGATK